MDKELRYFLLYRIIHTLIWLSLIGFLCWLFQSAKPLWLLIPMWLTALTIDNK